MTHQTILSPSTVALVEGSHPGLLSPEHRGQRQVSWGLLSPSTTASRSSSGSYTGNSSSRRASDSTEVQRSVSISDTPKITIPTRLDTAFTYEFLGFTEEMAVKLLASQKSSQSPQDVAREWISTQCVGVESFDDDWASAMQRLGIKDEVRVPMLKSEHSLVLYTQPLRAWLVEIVDTFYDSLVDLEANILLKLSESGPKLQGGAEEEEYTVPQAPRGHLAVFKSVDGRYLKGCVKEDRTVSLGTLESYFNTDFARRGGLYFTHQLWVAEAYSKLINDACSVADRRTMELHVPLSHFTKIGLWDLKFGDEWKQLLWYSRRGESLPKDLQRLKSQYGCIQGPIAHTHSSTIVRLSDWEQVAWKHVMTKEVEEGGEKETLVAMQQVWLGERAITDLENAVYDKSYVRLPERGFRKVQEPWKDLQHLE